MTESYLFRHFLSIRLSLELGELESVLWIPGTDNPVVGLTARCGEMGPFYVLFFAMGCFQPGVSRPLGGLASRK